ncbi:MAG: hypothetical protein AAGG69_14490, partial [Pseudomonadota bacterium]
SDGDIGADGSVSQKQLRHFTGSAATGGRKIASLRIDERSFDRPLFFNQTLGLGVRRGDDEVRSASSLWR